MDINHLVAVWRGTLDDAYASASVTGTLAIALKSLGHSDTTAGAQKLAQSMWDTRDKDSLPVAP